MSNWQHVSLAIATQADMHLPAFDYTKLSAINTCPTWGIIRYSLHKSMPGAGRAMALEAGKAMHECFSVIRLMQLGHGQAQNMREHMQHHGVRLFGMDKWMQIMAGWNEADLSITMRNTALECLATTAYVDDPYDKRRTYANLETSLLYYVQRWDANRYPIWIESNDPGGWVGVEIPFAIKVTATCSGVPANDLANIVTVDGGHEVHFLLTGRIDGLHTIADGSALLIQENKTASRMDEAWQLAFDVSHQPTGYTVAASLFAKQNVERGMIIGLSLPLPRNISDGFKMLPISRPQYMKERWLKWLEHTITMHNDHINDPLNAPKYGHSCNRYFRPCAFIPLCAGDDDEQKLILSEMVKEEWSPLAEKVGD